METAMAFHRTKRPLSRADMQRKVNAALRFHGIPVRHEVAPKRERAAPDPANTEAPVIAGVGELLAAHPQVLIAIRQNTGAMHVEGPGGRPYPIWFYKLVKQPSDEVTIPDFWGFLRNAKPFAIECKRPSWRAPRDERELKQLAFIRMVVDELGGVGGFARSVDEAKALLP